MAPYLLSLASQDNIHSILCAQPLLGLPCSLVQSFYIWLVAFAQWRVHSIPFSPSIPASGNGLWYKSTGSVWSKHYLPIGNGYLGAMVSGGTTQEITQLNIESLWSGGPFADPSYNGGNKDPEERVKTAKEMKIIQEAVFSSPSGTISDIDEMGTEAGAFGSYLGAGYMIATVDISGEVLNYTRWLDLDEAVTRTTWTQENVSYLRESFCSHPAHACVQRTVVASSNNILPRISYVFSTLHETGLPPPSITCMDDATLRVRGFAAQPGMLYEIIGRVQGTGRALNIKCTEFEERNGKPNATVTVDGAREAWITWVGDTNYDQDAGNESYGFSFRGPDPHNMLVSLISTATTYTSLWNSHQADVQKTLHKFSLSLGQTPNLALPTDELKAQYRTSVGDTYLEWLLFNYGRYLLWSSARGKLPANLQGKWADGYGNAWGADYHSNINIQMNYWGAEMTGLDVTESLFNYFEKDWAPRGSHTAKTLYNISRGWVTHNEMNIFGHTGMKLAPNSAQWANYPESSVWMMLHVWDHFDYTNNVRWWKAQGWPLIKGVASFQLEKLISDQYFNDSTLVVNPCNSPEQWPITFGCAHSQQLIWELFNAVEKGFDESGDKDVAFLEEVKTKRALMEKGIRIGSWGQLQEWKMDLDSPQDLHRHLSHLIGLYPGSAIASYDGDLQSAGGLAYTKEEVISAAKVSLMHRGAGTGPDADSGWEKVWRAACWAQLGQASEFFHILSYSIERNFGSNLFSLYDPLSAEPIFQIDANLGYPGAVMNALIQAPDVPNRLSPLIVTLLPALPDNWRSGSLQGARVRGGIAIDLQWSNGQAKRLTIRVDVNARPRLVHVVYEGKPVCIFWSQGGYSSDVVM